MLSSGLSLLVWGYFFSVGHSECVVNDRSQMMNRLLSFALYFTATLLGILAFLYPFLLPAIVTQATAGSARQGETPFMLILLLALCLLVLIYEAQGQTSNTRLLALLGVLVAINSALRFLEVAIPGPGGFSPIFFLIILTGYIFGGRFGFLMGALTMLVSAVITGGVGPWLPSQMFTAGWAGMSAPLCRPFVQAVKGENRRREVIILTAFGAAWGFLYGVIMNLWSWPFIVGPEAQYWTPGSGPFEILQRYAAYYAVTSLVWDLMAALGNAILILFFGQPTLRALRRFQARFKYQVLESHTEVLIVDA